MGLDIDQTARQLVTTWPTLREQLLRGTYRPSPVRRVTIPKPVSMVINLDGDMAGFLSRCWMDLQATR